MLSADNPFVLPSDRPFRLPPFERIRVAHYAPAFEAGMAEQLAEVDAISSSSDPPTFANTIEALELSGQLLDRVSAVFENHLDNDATDDLRALDARISPALAAHEDTILLDPRLFARVEEVYARREELCLDAEQRRLVERCYRDHVRAGTGLACEAQQRLRAANEELAVLEAEFSKRVLEGTNQMAVHVPDREQLRGLPEDSLVAAQQAARDRGHEDGYLLPLAPTTTQPILAHLHDRELRERVHMASVARCLGHDECGTRGLVTRMAQVRAERAELLGYGSHAEYVVAGEVAGDLSEVLRMVGSLARPAVANARAEAEVLEALLLADGEVGPLRPWDWPYYAERARRHSYEIDSEDLRSYFELERVLADGIFFAASQLYGLSFSERYDLPAHHPEARVFEVADPDGEPLGLLLADWFARESKRGGAWMGTFVEQSRLLDQRPVVVVSLNVARPPSGRPALMTAEEVRAAFHECGHALHALLSDVRYPRFSGVSVPRDFVECPALVNEALAWEPEVLQRYAVHYETNEPMPSEQRERLRVAQADGQGFATSEYLAATVLDLEWHRLTARAGELDPEDVEAFEARALEAHGLKLDAVPPRYRTCFFSHAFDFGYSACYYSYLWSEVMAADIVLWLRERGGLARGSGAILRRALLARGGAADPRATFEAVRGRAPSVRPLLLRRGLATATDGNDSGLDAP